MRRGNSITSGVTHFNFFWEPDGAGCGGSPLCGCCDFMGAVSRREAVPRVQVRAHPEPSPPTRQPWGDENRSNLPLVAGSASLTDLARMPHAARVSVRDALRLRAAALDLLSGRQSGWERLPPCSAETWDVFLRTERCALALKSRLAAPGPGIDAAATRELQRILSARGQLLHIGQLAATHGIPTIVLKGGVAVFTSSAPVDVHDVDVLVQPVNAERLAELLDKEGFSATGPAGTAHLAQRIAPHTVQIEVHFALNEFELTDGLWSRARALDGVAGLSRLGAADHLWHLLLHSVVTHPHRRGCMRDVLLAAEALADCAPSDLKGVERLVGGHPLAKPLGDQLAMAREQRDGVPTKDRFRREAAANYVLRGPLGWLGFSKFWTGAFVSALFSQLGSTDCRRHEWAQAWTRPDFPSPWVLAARLERRAPRLGRWCRTSVKVARLICARIAAFPIAVAARRLTS